MASRSGSDLGSKLDAAQAQKSLLAEEVTSLKTSLENTKVDLDQSQANLASSSNELDKANKELAALLKSIQDLEDQLKKMKQEKADLENNVESQSNRINELENDLQLLQDQKSELAKAIEDKEKNLSSTASNNTALEGELADLRNKYQMQSDILKSVKAKAEDDLTAAGLTIDMYKKKSADMEQQLEDVSNAINKLNNQLNNQLKSLLENHTLANQERTVTVRNQREMNSKLGQNQKQKISHEIILKSLNDMLSDSEHMIQNVGDKLNEVTGMYETEKNEKTKLSAEYQVQSDLLASVKAKAEDDNMAADLTIQLYKKMSDEKEKELKNAQLKAGLRISELHDELENVSTAINKLNAQLNDQLKNLLDNQLQHGKTVTVQNQPAMNSKPQEKTVSVRNMREVNSKLVQEQKEKISHGNILKSFKTMMSDLQDTIEGLSDKINEATEMYETEKSDNARLESELEHQKSEAAKLITNKAHLMAQLSKASQNTEELEKLLKVEMEKNEELRTSLDANFAAKQLTNAELDKYRELYNNSEQDKLQLARKWTSESEKLRADIKELEAEINELHSNVEKFTNLYNDELSTRQSLEISLKSTSEELSKSNDQLGSKAKELEVLKLSYEDLKSENEANFTAKELAIGELDKYRALYDISQQEKSQLSQELSSESEKLESLKKIEAALKCQLDENSKSLENLQAQHSKANRETEGLKVQVFDLENAINGVEKLLEAEKKNAGAVNEKLNAEIKQLEEKNAQLESNVQKFTNLYNEEICVRQSLEISLKSTSEELSKSNDQLGVKLEELETLEASYQDLKSDNEANFAAKQLANGELDKYRELYEFSEQEKAQVVKQLNLKSEQLESLKEIKLALKDQLDENLESLENLEAQHSKANRQIEDLKEQLSRLQNVKDSLDEELESEQKKAEAVNKKLNADIQELVAKIAELDSNVEKLSSIYNDELDARQNLEISLKVSNDKNSHMQNELQALQNQLSEALEKANNLELNLSDAEDALSEVTQAKKALQNQNATLSTELSEKLSVVDKTTTERDDLADSKAKLEKLLNDIQEESQNQSDTIASLNLTLTNARKDYEKSLADLRESINELIESEANLKKSNSDLSDEMKALQNEYQSFKDTYLEENSKMKEKIQDKDVYISSLELSIKNLQSVMEIITDQDKLKAHFDSYATLKQNCEPFLSAMTVDNIKLKGIGAVEKAQRLTVVVQQLERALIEKENEIEELTSKFEMLLSETGTRNFTATAAEPRTIKTFNGPDDLVEPDSGIISDLDSSELQTLNCIESMANQALNCFWEELQYQKFYKHLDDSLMNELKKLSSEKFQIQVTEFSQTRNTEAIFATTIVEEIIRLDKDLKSTKISFDKASSELSTKSAAYDDVFRQLQMQMMVAKELEVELAEVKDEFAMTEASLESQIKELEDLMANQSADHAQLVQSLQLERKELQSAKDVLLNSLENATERAETSEAELTDIEKKLQALSKMRDDLELKLESEQTDHAETIKQLEAEIASINKLRDNEAEDYQKQINALELELSRSKSENDDKLKTIDRIQSKNDDLEQDVANKEQDITDLEGMISKFSGNIDKLRGELKDFETNFNSEVASHRDTTSQLVALEQQNTDLVQKVQVLQEDLQAMTASRDDFLTKSQQQNEINNQLSKELSDTSSRLDETTKQVEESRDLFNNLLSDHENLQKQFASLSGVCGEATEKLTELHRRQDDNYEQKPLLVLIGDLSSIFDRLQTADLDLTSLQSKFDDQTLKLDKCQANLSDCEKNIQSLEDEKSVNLRATSELKASLSEIETALIDKKTELDEANDSYQKVKAEIDDLRAKLEDMNKQLDQKVDEIESQKAQFEKQEKDMETVIQTLTSDKQALNAEIKSTNSYVSYLKTELKDVRSSLDSTKEQLHVEITEHNALKLDHTKLANELQTSKEDLKNLTVDMTKTMLDLNSAQNENTRLDDELSELKTNSANRIAELKDEIEKLKTSNQEIAAQLASSKTLADQLNVQLTIAADSLSKVQNEKEKVDNELATSRLLVESLRSEIQELLQTNCKIFTF